ncbi:hypothetical protein [Bosea sp. (in: a-proteobacteria)]|jgi:hypothetical protein|uniref:hypothetical protein n=1 Tax=Bosea sp. (in: a-proteobacteria) TaxID=1871050 RepID=UPI002DDCC21F|nr:hypothetical protein [Bosea sp. (in: a-proteobacteria)]HEV2508658.1 hypothetical protein [Bosea sp. (in: a-proteobacteria)]
MSLAVENLFPLFAQPHEAEELTPAEARDVLMILGQVAERLSRSSNSAAGLRRRLDAIAGGIVAFMDQLDGDCEDEGAQCEDEGAQCDDEGERDDNGIADSDGQAEQWGGQHRYGGCVA